MIQLSERTLGDWLEHWAKETPDKEYIVSSYRTPDPCREGAEAGLPGRR